jgi:hypothetical protein
MPPPKIIRRKAMNYPTEFKVNRTLYLTILDKPVGDMVCGGWTDIPTENNNGILPEGIILELSHIVKSDTGLWSNYDSVNEEAFGEYHPEFKYEEVISLFKQGLIEGIIYTKCPEHYHPEARLIS